MKKTIFAKMTALFLAVLLIAVSFGSGVGTSVAYAKADDTQADAAVVSEGKKDTSERPSYFSMKDQGYVTSVKSQGRYGTCWSFATVAAIESTLLSQLQMTNEEYKAKYGKELDLSERSLAYFARTPLTDKNTVTSVFGSQTGEGGYVNSTSKNAKFNTGGLFVTATSVMSTGTGILYEEEIPYHGKKGLICYIYLDKDGMPYTYQKYYKTYLGMDVNTYMETILTDTSGDNKDAIEKGYTPTKLYYDTETDNWDVPEKYRFKSISNLMEGRILPCPVIRVKGKQVILGFEIDGEVYGGYNEAGTNAIKDELLSGFAVSIAFHADTSKATDTAPAKYINLENYAHYTYNGAEQPNHAVTIVGYDDNFKKENFLDHSKDPDGDGEAHFPEGDGAWIVKNSWGAKDNEFPNQGDWGTDGSGYFYLSYYDKSLDFPESFTFDISQMSSGATQYITNQYDTMPVNEYKEIASDKKLSYANVFCTNHKEYIQKISVNTAVEKTDVNVKIYALNDNYKKPTDGTLIREMNDTYTYAGYHSIYIEPIIFDKGTYYSVVVSEKRKIDGKEKNVVTVGTDISKEIMEGQSLLMSMMGTDVRYGVAVVNKGESFICVDGKWTDWATKKAEKLRGELIEGYRVDSINMDLISEDKEKGLISDEEFNSLMELTDLSEVPERYQLKNRKQVEVDNFSIKTYSTKLKGKVGNISYSLNKKGVIKLNGSGSLNQALENSLFCYAPWTDYYYSANKIIISGDITDVFKKNGKLNNLFDTFKGWIQIGTGKNAKLYMKKGWAKKVVKDKEFFDERTGRWYVADKDGLVKPKK